VVLRWNFSQQLTYNHYTTGYTQYPASAAHCYPSTGSTLTNYHPHLFGIKQNRISLVDWNAMACTRQVSEAGNCKCSNATISSTVPATAVTGLTGMRIGQVPAEALMEVMMHASNFSSGETEEYMVTITTFPGLVQVTIISYDTYCPLLYVRYITMLL
jgi:hypothetical protein